MISLATARKPKYSIIIPTLNEGKTIMNVIRTIPKFIREHAEVLVVDGNSSDDTREQAARAGARVVVEPGRGKGLAVARGIKESSGEYCIFLDGDGSMDPSEMCRLSEAAEKTDLVVGSRFLGEAGDVGRVHMFGNFTHNGVASLLFSRKITDINSGFKVIRADAARALGLKCSGFDIEAEILLKALKRGYRFAEVPIRTERRQHGVTKISSYRDGLLIFKRIIAIRLFG